MSKSRGDIGNIYGNVDESNANSNAAAPIVRDTFKEMAKDMPSINSVHPVSDDRDSHGGYEPKGPTSTGGK